MKSFAVAVLMATLVAAWEQPAAPKAIDAKSNFGNFAPKMSFPSHGFDIKDRISGFAGLRSSGALGGVAALRGIANAGPEANFANNDFLTNRGPSSFASPSN